ncbi:MAG: hypothetical protein IV107_23050 [Paucibacter sp.]|nr:hypothetical protein [Roseateles sp.]
MNFIVSYFLRKIFDSRSFPLAHRKPAAPCGPGKTVGPQPPHCKTILAAWTAFSNEKKRAAFAGSALSFLDAHAASRVT